MPSFEVTHQGLYRVTVNFLMVLQRLDQSFWGGPAWLTTLRQILFHTSLLDQRVDTKNSHQGPQK